MEIRLTENKDIPQLKKLFSEVFDPEGEYTELFFKKRYESTEGVAAFEGERLLSALYLMPCTLKTEGISYKMSYIFAVATFPSERGRGICSDVLKFAHEYLRKNGYDFASLVPAEKSLFDFYEKIGYEEAFYMDVKKYHILKSREYRAEKIKLSSYKDLREEVLAENTEGFLSWDEKGLDFCQADNNSVITGEIIAFPSCSRGYAVCQNLDNHVLIKELICERHKKQWFVNAVGNHYKKKEVILRDFPKDKSNPFGMIFKVSDKIREEDLHKAYFVSLPMD